MLHMLFINESWSYSKAILRKLAACDGLLHKTNAMEGEYMEIEGLVVNVVVYQDLT